MATLTDSTGRTLVWTSAGVLGFRNSRKSTTIGAQAVGEYIGTHATNHGIHRVYVRVKGLGFGKDTCIRALGTSGLHILSITDTTPIAHNGCRRPRARRT